MNNILLHKKLRKWICQESYKNTYTITTILKEYVDKKYIKNCKITAYDVNRADIIYVPAGMYIQGHMILKRPTTHDKFEKVPLPRIIAEYHRNLALYKYLFM